MHYYGDKTISKFTTTKKVAWETCTIPFTIDLASKGITGDGAYNIKYYSSDFSGNKERTRTQAIIIDNSPPSANIVLGSPRYEKSTGEEIDLWVTSITPLNLNAADNIGKDTPSGIERIEYRINSGQWTRYCETQPIQIAEDGMHLLSYRAVDNLGNTEETKSIDVTVDNRPSVTALSVAGPEYEQRTEEETIIYATASSSFTLIAEDGIDRDTPCGILNAGYKIDDAEWASYQETQLLVFVEEGLHCISYHSSDNLGNTEDTKSIKIFIDSAVPLTTFRLSNPNTYVEENTYISPVTPITLTALDSQTLFSTQGLLTYYKINDNESKIYRETFTLLQEKISEGINTITYYSLDCVGNTEAVNTYPIAVDNIAPTFTISHLPLGGHLIRVVASEKLRQAPEVLVVQSGAVKGSTLTMSSTDYRVWSGHYTAIPGYYGWASVYVKGEDRLGLTGIGVKEKAFEIAFDTQQALHIGYVYDSADPFAPPGESTAIHYKLNISACTVTIEIFDEMGALVKNTVCWFVSWGIDQTYVWDGKDNTGKEVEEGIYTYKLIAYPYNYVAYSPSVPKYGQVTVLKNISVNTEGAGIYNPGNASIKIIPFSSANPKVSTASFALKSQDLISASSIYDIGPPGAVFEPAAMLTIYYNKQAVAGFESELKIYKYDESEDKWEIVPGQVLDTVNNCIRVPITHLSLYSLLVPRDVAGIGMPMAEIIRPAQGSFVSGNVNIIGIAKGQFFSNYKLEYLPYLGDEWTMIGNAISYEIDSETLAVWNTSGLNGSYTLRLTAANRFGDAAVKITTLLADNASPFGTAISIGNPKYRETDTLPYIVTSSTPFYFMVKDSETNNVVASGVHHVEWLINGETQWHVAENYKFTILSSYSDGIYTIYYRAVDNAGNVEDSNSIMVVLDNNPPDIRLIYPAKGAIGISSVINSDTASIIGVIGDANFLNYRISILAIGETPFAETLISQDIIEEGTQTLAVLNRSRFADGWYLISIVSDDKLYNTSYDSVAIYLGNPEVNLVFGKRGNDDAEFKEPYGIAFSPTQTGSDNSGCIFITDNKNDRVQKFDLNGNFLLSFNGRSEEYHKLKKPSGIAVTTVVSGEWSADTRPMVFVADRDNDRIQAFNLFGNFLFSFGERHDIKRPEQISIGLFYSYSDASYSCTKAVYVADEKKDRIAIFDYEGNLLSTISGLKDPEGVFALNHSQGSGSGQISIYIANTGKDTVGVYTSALTPTLSIKGFDDPRAVCADNRGYIYVSDSKNDAVKKYNGYGQLLMTFTGMNTTALDKPAGICLDNNGNLWIVDEKNERILKISCPAMPGETSGMRGFSLPKAAVTIKDAYAYPIPFKPSQGHTAISFKLYSTLNVLLRIYNIAGELVFEKTDITTDPFVWSVVNNWDEPIASGVYIYFLTDSTLERKIGKIMIIR